MKISEITTIQSRDEDIRKYTYLFDGVQGSPAFGNLVFKQVEGDWDDHYFGLFNDTDLISILRVDKQNKHYQVTYTQTEPEFRGQGCIRYLLYKRY